MYQILVGQRVNPMLMEQMACSICAAVIVRDQNEGIIGVTQANKIQQALSWLAEHGFKPECQFEGVTIKPGKVTLDATAQRRLFSALGYDPDTFDRNNPDSVKQLADVANTALFSGKDAQGNELQKWYLDFLANITNKA